MSQYATTDFTNIICECGVELEFKGIGHYQNVVNNYGRPLCKVCIKKIVDERRRNAPDHETNCGWCREKTKKNSKYVKRADPFKKGADTNTYFCSQECKDRYMQDRFGERNSSKKAKYYGNSDRQKQLELIDRFIEENREYIEDQRKNNIWYC